MGETGLSAPTLSLDGSWWRPSRAQLMLVGAVTVEEPRGGLSPDACDAGWESGSNMIRHSPASWQQRQMTRDHLNLAGAGRQRVALARAI